MRPSASNYVHLEDVEIVRETDAAFFLSIDGEDHWIPKSQIADPERYSEGDQHCTISITEWIGNQKGIE